MGNETRERILAFVQERIVAGFPPTLREIQAEFGFRSVASARQHIDILVKEGRLARLENTTRGYRLPGAEEPQRPVHRVPVLGAVQAGDFQPAVEDIETYVWVEGRYSPGEVFGLRVRGLSMRDAHILPGDIVIVQRQKQAEPGQIVVALVDDEATVKFFRRRGPRVELHPANSAFPILKPDPERLAILGRVVEVRRSIA